MRHSHRGGDSTQCDKGGFGYLGTCRTVGWDI